MGIGKRGWTSMLEELREAGSSACLRTVVVVPATQLIGTKRLTPALAGHHLPMFRWGPHLQLPRTRLQ